jgi:hypothetical protein
MSFNQFTNLDFNDIRSQIKDYLRSNSNFTDFDFEGSNFSTIIDILAYNSYITAFNTNMAVNESFIDSATLRENVVSLARNIGYVPRSKRSSRSIISFSVDTSRFSSTIVSATLKAGIVALGSIQGGNYIFSIPEDITIPVNNSGFANFNNIEIYEGSYLTKSYTIKNTPNEKFIIPNSGVDTSTIRVTVTDTSTLEYALYDNIFEVNKDSRIFLLQEIEDEQYEIIFGDNIIGKRPVSGSSVLISYIITNGKEANNAANFTFSGVLIDNNQNTITEGISALTTIQASENGDDIEPIESIKYLGPRVYASQYRAVTANDYKGLIPYIFPNIESVTAYGGEELNPPEYGKVFISVKPRNGSYLSELTKESIRKKLKQYTIAGISPQLVDLKYLYIELDINVYYNRSFTSNIIELQSEIYNSIEKYAKSRELNNFGGRFKYSKVVSLVDDVNSAITSNITKVRIRRDLLPIYNRLATYEICFGNRFHIKKQDIIDGRGYNIKSTGFTIDGIDGTLYMSDFPIDNETGSIFFFKLVENRPFIVSNNIGIVDYIKGEILLSPIIFTGSENELGIQIQATPESNDVIALQDIYLELNIANTVVNMVEDTISSGENISGTEYIVTSSYINGKFTR